MKVFTEHASSFNEGTGEWLQSLDEKIGEQQSVAKRFEGQLQLLLARDVLPEDNSTAQKRIISAVEHFTKEWEALYADDSAIARHYR